MTPRGDPDVLVVGAGPTGLTLAAQAAAHGADVRIVERRPGLVRESRAVVVHPRTLEMLRPLGVADQLVRHGNANAAFEVHFADKGSVAGRLTGLGLDDTSYPFLLVIPQVETEAVLSEHVRERGLTVERGVELASVAQEATRLVCTLAGADGRLERVEPKYLVGCDGAASTVRRQSAIPFAGSDYPVPLVLADLEVTDGLAPETAHAFVARPGILFFFPIAEPATWRMLAVRPPGCDGSESLGQLQQIADLFTGGAVRLHEPVWRTELWLQTRLSARYREGRVFLAGDAAHVHSPAIAQGMNAGMRDGCNLGWKLGMVSRGVATDRLLDSYEAEHRPLARLIRAATDVAYAVETGDHPIAELIRTRLAPTLTPIGLRSSQAVRAVARTVAGLRFTYRGSPAVQRRGGLRRRPRPGDRLPDVRVQRDGRPIALHEALASPAFHLLACGQPGSLVADRAELLRRSYPGLLDVQWLSVQAWPGVLFDENGTAGRLLGARHFTYLLIRPDGYVAARGEDGQLRAAREYLRTWLRRAAS